jgi:predicted flap endonuclease-1-like 5' DNA nuclease
MEQLPENEEITIAAEDIVEPPPAISVVEPETDDKPQITFVDVGHESDVEAAAEKVAANIKENADQIKAMLKTEAAARQVDAQVAAPTHVVELSKTIPELTADLLKFATGAFKSGMKTVQEKIEESRMNREADIVDTQERSDAIASQVGEDEAANAPVENINLTDGPNEQVEGLPKPGETELSGIGDDLTKIDGIGAKMSEALKHAGYDGFAKLANASEDELRNAIHAAGIRLAPNLSTWAEQATYAEQGEWEKLAEYQKLQAEKRNVTM